MGCDAVEEGEAVLYGVSIHAPTWGATAKDLKAAEREMFQSTHPHGVRLDGEGDTRDGGDVSIHAPTWGATLED